MNEHSSFQQIHQRADDVQSETGSFAAPFEFISSAVEHFEDLLPLVGGNPFARIGHTDHDLIPIGLLQRDVHVRGGASVLDGIVEQKFVLVGFAAYLMLIPLAATSTKWAMRKLGKNWKRLHKLVYLIGALGIIHFVWLVKNVYTRPILYGLVLAILLLARIGPVKQQLVRWRRAMKGR